MIIFLKTNHAFTSVGRFLELVANTHQLLILRTMDKHLPIIKPGIYIGVGQFSLFFS
jgi:hypothetical protein